MKEQQKIRPRAMKKAAPCIDCTEREIGCHARCERYGAYARERSSERDRIIREREKDDVIRDLLIRKRWQARKRRNTR